MAPILCSGLEMATNMVKGAHSWVLRVKTSQGDSVKRPLNTARVSPSIMRGQHQLERLTVLLHLWDCRITAAAVMFAKQDLSDSSAYGDFNKKIQASFEY